MVTFVAWFVFLIWILPLLFCIPFCLIPYIVSPAYRKEWRRLNP